LRGKPIIEGAIKSVVNMQKMYCVLDLQAKPQPHRIAAQSLVLIGRYHHHHPDLS